jgi:hypothetical protein
MEYVTIHLEVLTPAFVAGAEQDTVELRSASIRGLVRWWWRADRDHLPVGKLIEEEGTIFGSAELGLKSPLGVDVSCRELKIVERGDPAPRSGVTYEYRRNGQKGTTDVLPYLAYGPVRLLSREEKERARANGDRHLLDQRGQPASGPVFIRPAVAPATSFDVRCSWRESTLSRAQVESVVRAACAWVTLGGIGTRSRKGFGALSGGVSHASSPELLSSALRTWEAAAKALLTNGDRIVGSDLPTWPSLRYRVVHVGSVSQSWQQALGQLGEVYKARRPKGMARWIAGDASPRRASAVLLTVERSQGGFQPVVALLPCDQRGDGQGEEAMCDFIEEFRANWRLC